MLSITEQHATTAYRAGSGASIDSLYRARPALPTLVFQSNSPASAVTWSDNGAGGTFVLSGTDNAIAAYTPLNKTKAVDISATDTAGTLHYPIQIYGTIPVYPQLGYETELDIDTKTKTARDGTQYHREDGIPLIGWVFAWDNRQDDEVSEMRDFWFNHRKVIPFYLIDTEGDILNLVKFTSSIKFAPNGANRWAMGASFKGAYQPVIIVVPTPPSAPTGLRLTVLSESSILSEWDALPDSTPPSVPTMNAGSVISDTEIDWSWTAATDDTAVTGYDLQVALDAGFTTGLVTHNLGNVLNYPSTGLTGATQYYARVRAHDAIPNNSAYSSSVNATTNAPPPPSQWQTPPPADWVLNSDFSREATAATFAGASNIVAPRINSIGDYIEVVVLSVGTSGGSVGGWFLTDSLGKQITISSSGVMSSTDVGDQYLSTGWTVGDTLRIEKTGATQLTITKVGVEFQVMNQVMTGNVELHWGGLTATGEKLANPVTNI